MSTNGVEMEAKSPHQRSIKRAEEAEQVLDSIKELVVKFIHSADSAVETQSPPQDESVTPQNSSNDGNASRTLLDYRPPKELQQLLNFRLPEDGQGISGVAALAQRIQQYSVNTWDQGFLDKLYHSPTPIGLAADLLLSSLNTNVHIYQVSPALTMIEKHTTQALASAFGLNGRFAGGISQPGGSAANQTSLIIARNTLFPETKSEGNGDRRFVLFTSEHGHYSLEKAAQISGLGSNAVRSVPVDQQGRMRPDALDFAIQQCKANGETVFYVNATAGTTVLGSFDPLDAIADICQRHRLWMHVDASWGGPVVFSDAQRWKLRGADRADSIAMCPHKMMGVPLTCSVLLGRDLRTFHRAMTLPAGYLFHGDDHDDAGDGTGEESNGDGATFGDGFWDLADLTPQCGRRGDMLKLALSWVYYGTAGYAAYIDHAFAMAAYLTKLVAGNPRFSLVSSNPPPCLQVCFYYDKQSGSDATARNSKTTEKTKTALLKDGFMIDYAPGEEGKFFRVVVNGQTRKETVERLVGAIEKANGGTLSG